VALIVFYVFFGVILALCLISVILLIIFLKAWQKARFFMHIFWNITMLTVLITFLLGALFMAFGILCYDSVAVVKYIFSAQNLITDQNIISGGAGELLNICFNGDGNLTSYFNMTSGNNSKVGEFGEEAQKLEKAKTELNKNKNSEAVKKINKAYDEFEKDISKTTETEPEVSSVRNWILDLNSYTNGAKGEKQQCYSEQWASDQGLCSRGYTYYSKSEVAGKSGNICLVIKDWLEGEPGSRYSKEPCNYLENVNKDHKSLLRFYNENKVLLEDMKTTNNYFDGNFTTTAILIVGSVDRAVKVLTPMDDALSGSVLDLFNCSILINYLLLFRVYGQRLRNFFRTTSKTTWSSSF
jgi:energy-coupling factor transporter transmembrane protein EcfT